MASEKERCLEGVWAEIRILEHKWPLGRKYVLKESVVKTGFWNINGLSEENMSDESFKWEINNKYDILLLCETWLRRENINNLRHPNGYLYKFVFKIKGEKKAVHEEGEWVGIVYFRNELNKAVSVFDKWNENIIWIKLGKIPWIIKVTLILPVYIISQKTRHTLKKINAIFSSL